MGSCGVYSNMQSMERLNCRLKWYCLLGILLFVPVHMVGSTPKVATWQPVQLTCRFLNCPDSIKNRETVEFITLSPLVVNATRVPLEPNGDSYSVLVRRDQAICSGILSFGRIGRIRMAFDNNVCIVFDFAKIKRDKFGFFTSGVSFSGSGSVLAGFYHDYIQMYFGDLLLRPEYSAKNRMPKGSSVDVKIKNVDLVFSQFADADHRFFLLHPNYSVYEWLAKEIRTTRLYTDYLNISADGNIPSQSLTSWSLINRFVPSFYDADAADFLGALKRSVVKSVQTAPKVPGPNGLVPMLMKKCPDMRSSLRDSLVFFLEMKKCPVDSSRLVAYERQLIPRVLKEYGNSIKVLMLGAYLDKTLEMLDRPLAEWVMLQFCPRDGNSLRLFCREYGNRFVNPVIQSCLIQYSHGR